MILIISHIVIALVAIWAYTTFRTFAESIDQILGIVAKLSPKFPKRWFKKYAIIKIWNGNYVVSRGRTRSGMKFFDVSDGTWNYNYGYNGCQFDTIEEARKVMSKASMNYQIVE